MFKSRKEVKRCLRKCDKNNFEDTKLMESYKSLRNNYKDLIKLNQKLLHHSISPEPDI